MGEKTEQATPKKLSDARKKGQIAKSQDAGSAVTFMIAFATIMHLMGNIYDNVSEFLISVLTVVGRGEGATVIPTYFHEALSLILQTSIPIIGLVALGGVMINFLLVGPLLTFEVFKPDIKKFDPIANLKGKFKLKTFVELLKSIFKILGAATIILIIIIDLIPEVIQTVQLSIFAVIPILGSFLSQVIIKVGIFFCAVAALDLVYQKKTFSKEMMMEKFETKQEYKNSEGDPQIKSKRKEIAREIAYSDGPAEAVKYAKAVITNPTHLAIAIGYRQEEDPAPFILTMGKNYVADVIIEEAKRLEVPILRNIDLAHRLIDEGKEFDFIPESTYEAVAEILKWLASLEEDSEST